MEIRQLEYFAAVAQLGGIRRAARELSVGPSTLSEQIRLLERELGVRLLDRVGRRISLTEAGLALRESTHNALSDLKKARQQMINFSRLEGGELIAGTMPGRGNWWLASFLDSFMRAYPQLKVRLVERNSTGLMKMLESGEIHSAWFTVPERGGDFPPGISCRLFGTAQLAAIVPDNHRFARMERVPLTELAHEPLVLASREETSRTILDEALMALGVEPNVRIEADDPVTLMSLAARHVGVGVTFVPPRLYDGTVAIPLGSPPLKGVFGVAWSEERGARVRGLKIFVDFFEQWWRERAPPLTLIPRAEAPTVLSSRASAKARPAARRASA